MCKKDPADYGPNARYVMDRVMRQNAEEAAERMRQYLALPDLPGTRKG